MRLRPARAAGSSSDARGLWARPPFFHPLQALGHGSEAIVELETGRGQRRAAIIGEGTPDRAAVPAYDRGLGLRASLHGPFQGAYATDLFFEDLFGMPVSLIDGLGRFVQVVKVTQLVGYLREGLGDSCADRQLPIGNDPHNGHVQRLLDLAEQRG